VGLSTALYVGRLGFYSDDWAFLGVLSTAEDRSVPGLIREQFYMNANLRMRPTQIVVQAILHRLFGIDPVGYHVANALVLAVVAVLLYWLLRELGLPRMLAVAVPSVYALAPNYSTDRFWFAAFGYLISISLYLVALYGDLRAVAAAGSAHLWRWKMLAVAALIAAGFGYEVVVPFFVLNVLFAEVAGRRLYAGGLRARLGRAGLLAFHGSTLAVAIVAIVYKATVAEAGGPADLSPALATHAVWLMVGALATNLGTYGVALPHTVVWSAPHAGVAGVAIASVIGAAVYLYLARLDGRAEPWSQQRVWWRLGGCGLIVLALGYAIFLTTDRIGFSSTGMSNRTAAAGTLGAAMVLVAGAGWLGSRLPVFAAKGRGFRAGMAAVCAAGVVITNGLAGFWVESRHAQQAVLADLHQALPVLPPGSIVLLHGVCPYIGPAVIFESRWDFAGALQVHHHDRSLRGDVTSADIAVEPQGIRTRIYGTEVSYRYGNALLLYDRHAKAVATLSDQATARRRLASSKEGDECPAGRPGEGAVRLPFDSWFKELETSRFRPWRAAQTSVDLALDAAGGGHASGPPTGER
jgi:hypothetical protein